MTHCVPFQSDPFCDQQSTNIMTAVWHSTTQISTTGEGELESITEVLCNQFIFTGQAQICMGSSTY